MSPETGHVNCKCAHRDARVTHKHLLLGLTTQRLCYNPDDGNNQLGAAIDFIVKYIAQLLTYSP